jgi:hypothetical protein
MIEPIVLLTFSMYANKAVYAVLLSYIGVVEELKSYLQSYYETIRMKVEELRMQNARHATSRAL